MDTRVKEHKFLPKRLSFRYRTSVRRITLSARRLRAGRIDLRFAQIPHNAAITGRLVKAADDGFVKRDVVFKLESVLGVSEGDQTDSQ